MPGTLPSIVYRSIYSMQIFFFLSSRVQQIITNYRNKSTGALSPITMFLGWAGNLARLFTLLVDLGFEDLQIILSYFVFFVCNFTPFMQYFIYMGQKVEQTPKKEKDEVVKIKKKEKKGDREEKEAEEEKPETVVTRRKKTKKRDD